ncbi:SOS response-associated peptidase [Acetobacter sp. TBRC 12305]|uniref:Abasic site processing protein n=1 Tax=Acetobacter garciniae TaxID=2817435 RepID=A0A939HRB3_9PROT|nr:SOS response-associated peptidase [Acetobacter garciniae]MBO1326752.1 SOS response-associated peptidase [Acetobacter garciniae]MBX0345950.1 SOS response-associated peptidase [Acetobacter garciniae]
MCNLYSMTGSQAAIGAATRVMIDRTGNLPSFPEIWPDYAAPIVRNGAEGRELVLVRWGMPSPAFALKGHKVDRGVTNIRNTASPHWRRWLGVEHRCLVPFTAFAENGLKADGSIQPVWFAGDQTRPLRFFAGLWARWTSVRKLKEGEVTADLFGFLTTEANGIVGPYHPKAMPVILDRPEDLETWLTAPWDEALSLQRPLPDDRLVFLNEADKSLQIVANKH